MRITSEIPRNEIVAHYITGWDGSKVTSTENNAALNRGIPLLDVEAYSRFKHGDASFANMGGQILSRLFIHSFPNYFEKTQEESNHTPELVITESPYHTIPGSATFLLQRFVDNINKVRVSRKLSTVETTKFHRLQTYSGDFSKLSEKDRMENMRRTAKYYIDCNIINGKHLVVVDDCVISGSHMENIYNHLSKTGVAKVTFIFLVGVTDNCDCGVENFLNVNFVKDIDTWSLVQQNPSAKLTQRALKFLLNSFESETKITRELYRLPIEIMGNIYFGAINEGFSEVSHFKRNFDLVEKCWNQRFQLN